MYRSFESATLLLSSKDMAWMCMSTVEKRTKRVECVSLEISV